MDLATIVPASKPSLQRTSLSGLRVVLTSRKVETLVQSAKVGESYCCRTTTRDTATNSVHRHQPLIGHRRASARWGNLKQRRKRTLLSTILRPILLWIQRRPVIFAQMQRSRMCRDAAALSPTAEARHRRPLW